MAEEAKAEHVVDTEGFVDITSTQDGGLLKKVLVEGSGDERPPIGSRVHVHYTGTLTADGSKFDSSRDRNRLFTTKIGVGEVIKGWDIGMPTMRRGEKAILRARHDYAYGEDGSPPTIPGGASLDFEVELFNWDEKDPEDMAPEERSAYAMKQKDLGNQAFKEQNFTAAASAYAQGAKYITYGQNEDASAGGHGHSHGGQMCHSDHGGGDDVPELGEEDKKLAVALLTNCAMARLRNDEPDLAKFDCSQALQLDSKNVKAIFRLGKAKLALGEHDAAMEDAALVLEIEPGNKDAELLQKQVDQAKRQAKQKEKAMYSKMFG